MANSVDPDQTAPIGAVCSGSTLFAYILNWSVMLGNYLQQTTFSDAFFFGALRFKILNSLPNAFFVVCFYEKFLQEYHQSVQFGSRSGQNAEMPFKNA